jgi:hypothetical protein
MEKILGYPVIQWEVKTVRNNDVDFVVEKESQIIYCEVKSPGWESELNHHERLSNRGKIAKHISGEARPLGCIQAIRYSIKKAYSKFSSNSMNLLIINDDLFSPALDNPRRIDIALLHPEFGPFVNNDFENLGGILFINCIKISDIFEYRRKFVKNENSKEPTLKAGCR